MDGVAAAAEEDDLFSPLAPVPISLPDSCGGATVVRLAPPAAAGWTDDNDNDDDDDDRGSVTTFADEFDVA